MPNAATGEILVTYIPGTTGLPAGSNTMYLTPGVNTGAGVALAGQWHHWFDRLGLLERGPSQGPDPGDCPDGWYGAHPIRPERVPVIGLRATSHL